MSGIQNKCGVSQAYGPFQVAFATGDESYWNFAFHFAATPLGLSETKKFANSARAIPLPHNVFLFTLELTYGELDLF